MAATSPSSSPASRSGWDRLLDRSIVLSFDATGFRRHARAFEPGDLDVDLRGRVWCVTGANAGIGRATALGLAARGATVYLLCRNRGRGLEAQDSLRAQSGNPRVYFEPLDVGNLASVRAFAARFSQTELHGLVHNAGVMVHTRTFTDEDLELTWATNVFGPFLLTQCLQERLTRADGARVVWVSSGGMYSQKLDLQDLRWQHTPYDGVVAYAQTKRAEVVLTELMAAKLAPHKIWVNAMHPGWADTQSVQVALPRFHRLTRRILRTPEQAADTVLWLSVCARLEGQTGGFWMDRAPAPTHLTKRTHSSPEVREALYELCVRTTASPESSRSLT